MSIAWLAHQLSSPHDADERRTFDSIIVVTDRRVLDRQLDRTIRSFETTLGMVAHADSAQELKEALEQMKNIIVSTLQKFPYISQEMGRLPGTRFAVIVDEAHSSQSGEMTKSLKQVLTSSSLEEAEREDELEMDVEDQLVAEMKSRGPQEREHVRVHGHAQGEDAGAVRAPGRPGPLRAVQPVQYAAGIEEGFILDVLQNYTTYQRPLVIFA